MKIFVYNMREFDELPRFEKYAKEYGIEFDYTTEAPSPDNYHLAKGYDGLSIITTITPAEMLDAMKENGIKVISTRTIGYEHIDLNHAKEIGMGICNVTYDPASVAEYTIMMILLGCRKMRYVMERAEVQDFTLKGKLARELIHSTVGVIGTGRIGSHVIKILKGFGAKILCYDIYPREDIKEMAEYVDLETLYKESDIITLHAPATEDNYHMLNKDAFEKMKDGVIIVNCARGHLINTGDMIDYLTNGKIGIAALDVLEREAGLYYNDLSGRVIDNPEMATLKKMQNVIFAPHMAFYTEEAVSNMVENSIKGIKAYLTGEDDPFIVNR
ncbi:MAG: lactate dehydrogenase [Firmicutes bacterium]|nr:lactate dehydrogenase [Bacillota bacterium]